MAQYCMNNVQVQKPPVAEMVGMCASGTDPVVTETHITVLSPVQTTYGSNVTTESCPGSTPSTNYTRGLTAQMVTNSVYSGNVLACPWNAQSHTGYAVPYYCDATKSHDTGTGYPTDVWECGVLSAHADIEAGLSNACSPITASSSADNYSNIIPRYIDAILTHCSAYNRILVIRDRASVWDMSRCPSVCRHYRL